MTSFTLSRQRALVLAVAALLAVLVAPKLLGHHATSGVSSTPRSVAPAPRTREAARSPAASSFLVVDVAGAVRRPGLYRLPQGSRIADAIARAGGATRTADQTLVNLAAPIADGEQVLVPATGAGVGSAGGAAPPSAGAGAPTAPVDLNSATAAQLDALPGVGPVTAQKIVDYRQQHGPFTSVDDLDAISGIGPAKIANLKGLVIP